MTSASAAATRRLNASQLLDAAERLLDEDDAASAGVWQRTAALLIREAIELALTLFWRRRAPSVLQLSTSDRWLCLPAYLGERPAAHAAEYAWTALSDACHYRSYDVGLTQDELRAQLATARAFLVAVARALTPDAGG